jgi:hypothetical protein
LQTKSFLELTILENQKTKSSSNPNILFFCELTKSNHSSKTLLTHHTPNTMPSTKKANGSAASPSAKGVARRSPPSSEFKARFTSSPMKASSAKDYRHRLCCEGVLNGIVVFYLMTHKEETGAFIWPDIALLRAEPELVEKLGANSIVPRRGGSGDIAMKQGKEGDYDWLQFLAIIGEDEQTPEKRREVADKIIKWLNSRATAENYAYPHEVKFHEDRTPDALKPCDSVLLDRDVLSMMITAYPENNVDELIEYDEIMESFWTEPGHGTQFIRNYLASGQAGPPNASA